MKSVLEDKRWNIFKYAYTNVPAYRDLLKKQHIDVNELIRSEKWEYIPIVNKNEIIYNTEKFISEEYFVDVALDRLIHTHTSGSTGTFLDVYWKKEDLNRALMPLWIDRWKSAHVNPEDKLCQFNTTLCNNQKYEINGNKLVVSKQHLFDYNFYEICKIIKKFSPKWLIIHPAIARTLLDKTKFLEESIFSNLKYIELTGEMVLPGLVEELQNTWNCMVKKHYGCMETQTIGYEDKNSYRIYQQSTYVEILDEMGKKVSDGNTGNIFVTSLHNNVMPFIRYGVGDRGRIYTKNIDGCVVKYLYLEKARKNDRILLENGQKIAADILLKPIELINGYYQNVVHQFQAIQLTRDKIKVKIVSDDDFDKQKIINIYLQSIQQTVLNKIKFEFEFNKCLYPNETSGKIRWFICEI